MGSIGVTGALLEFGSSGLAAKAFMDTEDLYKRTSIQNKKPMAANAQMIETIPARNFINGVIAKPRQAQVIEIK